MTPIREISRNGRIAGKGEVPPGCVDGFCAACKCDVIADEADPRCDHCGNPLHPASLPFPPRSASQSAESEPEAVEPTPRPLTPVKARPAAAEARTVTLAPTRAALAWSHATDALVAEAERDEAEAEKAFQQAKARRDQARRQANYARQLRQLVQVDGATDALPAAVKRTAGRQKQAGRWARDWDACRLCGTTEGKHVGKGRCGRCAKHFEKHGVEWPNKETVNDGGE